MSLELYREDPEKQEKGTPIYLHGMTFWVRRWGTPVSQKALKRLALELFPPMHKREPTDDDKLIAYWLTDYGVSGWEGVTKADGTEVEYSVENAHKIFMDEAYWLSLNRALYQDAANFENYLHDQAEEDLEAIKKL